MLPLKAAVDLVRPLVLGDIPADPLGPLLILAGVRVQRLLSGTGAHPAPVLPLRRRVSRAAHRRPMLMQARPSAPAPAARSSLAARRCACCCVALVLLAAALPARAADEFLAPEQAFQFSARAARRASRSRSTFAIAPGYYLYREQFKFAADRRDARRAGDSRRARSSSTRPSRRTSRPIATRSRIVVPVAAGGRASSGCVVTSQGCADAGLCYPPMQSAAAVEPGRIRRRRHRARERPSAPGPSLRRRPSHRAPTAGTAPRPRAERGRRSTPCCAAARFWPIVGAFFIAGLLLSLTPCVLPMLPIVSSIIVGQAGSGRRRRSPARRRRRRRLGGVARRGFALAASYSFGMAVVYTAFGVVAGLAGEGPRRRAAEPVGARRVRARRWSRSRCRCSASTSCSCRRRSPAGSTTQLASSRAARIGSSAPPGKGAQEAERARDRPCPEG